MTVRAEDNLVNQLLLVRMLEKHGHAVVVAGNGHEALAALAGEAFDTVLMDIQMPAMDGFEATAAIRKQEEETGRHLPIVALTAHAMEKDQERCLHAGMDAYLAKPIRAAELFATLENLLPRPMTPRPSAVAQVQGSVTFDQAALLARVAMDRSILKEILDLFLAECPRLLDELRQAVQARSAKELAFVAHTLLGALSAVSAPRAATAAAQLELMGRAGDLSAVEPALGVLEAELEALRPALIAAASADAGPPATHAA